MAANDIRPETSDERLIYGAIVWTWGLYLLGALYAVYPILGWVLAVRGVRRIMHQEQLGHAKKRPLPASAILWIIGMVAMTVPLVYAHMSYDMGVLPMIKSLFGWARGWFLLALFVLAGATLRIRSQLLIRAVNRLALITLCIVPILIMAAVLKLPETLYVSPLQMVFQGPKSFFDVDLHSYDDSTGAERWRFFAPWAPAAAGVATMSFALSLHDKSLFWRTVGIVSSIVVCVMAQSRLALVALPIIVTITLISRLVLRPWAWMLAAITITILILSTGQILNFLDDLQTAFTGARASSSRVRSVLQSIALHRWWAEAPIFGHGTVERGPHLVEFMPIGTHHTWNGLLFVKGAVGFIALAIPFAASALEFSLKSLCDQTARAALGVLVAVLLFSFGENLESLAYLLWPGFLMIGIAMRQKLRLPPEFVRLLAAARADLARRAIARQTENSAHAIVRDQGRNAGAGFGARG
jgi:hypothetical protein